MSEAVDALVWQWGLLPLSYPVRSLGFPLREYRFHPTRKWRFDIAWPTKMVAVEVDGGAWIGGRHTSGSGFEADCVKLSTAAAMGWRVLRVTPRMIRDGVALTLIEQALAWPR